MNEIAAALDRQFALWSAGLLDREKPLGWLMAATMKHCRELQERVAAATSADEMQGLATEMEHFRELYNEVIQTVDEERIRAYAGSEKLPVASLGWLRPMRTADGAQSMGMQCCDQGKVGCKDRHVLQIRIVDKDGNALTLSKGAAVELRVF